MGAPGLFSGTLEMERAAEALDEVPHKAGNSQHYEENSQHKHAEGMDHDSLRTLAAPIRSRQRARPEEVRAVILALCSENYLSLRELAELLGRQPASVQNHYLTPMLKEGVLVQRYSNNPNHPNQGYRKAKPVEG